MARWQKWDKRHLYLAKEGVVVGSALEAMTASDKAKREHAARERKVRSGAVAVSHVCVGGGGGDAAVCFSCAVPRLRVRVCVWSCVVDRAVRAQTKLASPNFFVSPTRLSIRNLGKDVDSDALRTLVTKARAGARLCQIIAGACELCVCVCVCVCVCERERERECVVCVFLFRVLWRWVELVHHRVSCAAC